MKDNKKEELVEELIYDEDGNEIGIMTTETVEEIEDEELEKVTGGARGRKMRCIGYKSKTITLRYVGHTATITNLPGGIMNAKSNSSLVKIQLFRGSLGVSGLKVKRVSSRKGYAHVSYDEMKVTYSGYADYYRVSLTVHCI